MIKNMHHTKLVPGGIRIDRATKWGNPFIMYKEEDRDHVCEQYEKWLKEQIAAGKISQQDLAALADHDLYCWCAPLRCHGEILHRMAQEAKKCLKSS